LVYWNRAANQGNVDARVKVGDYYYYGLGHQAVHAAMAKAKNPVVTPPVQQQNTLSAAPAVAESTETQGAETSAEVGEKASPEPAPQKPEVTLPPPQPVSVWSGLVGTLLGWPRRGAPNYERAAMYYQTAADSEHSSLAMWNLAWMHECGVGVERDFHLAKRYYDR
jgi:TPR repeat protein